jgi:hypothetical protein
MDSFLMSTTNVNFNTSIMDFTIEAAQTKPLVYFWNLRSNITRAQTSIPGGEVWTLNLFAKPVTSADIQNVAFKFKVFRITSTTQALATSFILDTAGTAMPPVNLPSNVLSVGTVSTSTSLSTNGIALYQMALQVPFTDVSDPNTYLQVQIYATNLDPDRTHYCKLYFQNTNGGYTDPTTGLTYASTYSYLRTTFGAAGIQGAQGIQGEQGIQGVTGSRGATGSAGVQGIQGSTGGQGTAGIQGPRGDAVGPKRAIQYKHAITEVLDGTQYFLFDTSDNNGTMTVPNIVMQGSPQGSIITPHRIDVNNPSDTTVAPLYLSAGAYGKPNYGTGFMTVGLKYDSGTGTVTKPAGSNEVNFGFQTTYGLQSVAVGAAALGPGGLYAYRLSRRNGGTAESAMEIMQNGTRFSLNSDRYLLSSSSGNSNGAPNTLMDLTAPVYDASTSFMLSTRVGVNAPGDEYPVWLSCHQGTNTYGNTGAMIKMNSDEIAFMGPVKFLKGMDTSGGTLNLNTDISGTINVGDRSSFINIGNGPQITAISIGSGGATSVPTTIDIGNGLTTGTLNLGTGATIGGVVNIGTSANGGKSIINIGGVGDEVNIMGSVTYVNTTNLDVSDNLITLNKGATATSTTIQGAGIQLSRLNNSSVETTPGWIKTDGSNARSWEIVPPNHPVEAFAEQGNGLAVCNVQKSATSDSLPVVGLRTTKASSNSIQNLILKPDGNVGIGYADAALASVPNFPSSLLHIESTAGNQITLGSGNDNSSVNYVRTFLSSPISGNSNVILAVGRNNNGLRVSSISSLSSGFRLAYTDSAVGSSSTLALACTNNDNASAFSTNLTFFRSDGTALFTSKLCIDNNKFFRMYNSTFSVLSQTENMTVEIDGSAGAMRMKTGLVLGSVVQSLADSSRLDVIDTTDAKLRLLGGSNRFNVGTKSSGESYLMNVDSQDLEFGTGNTYRMTIKNTGNIGIGTRTPSTSYQLDISGSTRVSGTLTMAGTLNMSSNIISNVNNPSSLQDVATKSYVDSIISSTGSGSLYPTVERNDSINDKHYLTFIKPNDFPTSNGGNKRAILVCDNSLNYNPFTDTLTATTFSGSLSGNATYATSAGSAGSAGSATSATSATSAESAGYAGYVTEGIKNGSDYVLYRESNNIGIGTKIPTAKLDVRGTGSSMSFTGIWVTNYFNMGQGSNAFFAGIDTINPGGYSSSTKMGIYSDSYILAAQGFCINSDKRIKSNIIDICTKEALSQLRKLEPKKFTRRTSNLFEEPQHNKYGFIAQEVECVIPHSVITTREIVSNFMVHVKLSKVTDEMKLHEQLPDDDATYYYLDYHSIDNTLYDENYKFTFTGNHDICGNEYTTNTHYPSSDISGNQQFKILLYSINAKKYEVFTKKISDKRLLIFSDTVFDEDVYLLCGQEVDDFKNLDNDPIVTLTTAALQEVDRQQQHDKARISELEIQVSNLKTVISAQQFIIDNILERLKSVGV